MTTELLFTAVPLDGFYPSAAVRLSVVVSPRLRGGDRLRDYPGSMLHWTRLIQEQGLTLELEVGSRRLNLAVDTARLQPDLWDSLFTPAVPVRSHRFDQALVTRATKGVASFSMRESLSLIKAIYRQATVDLAVPREGTSSRHDLGNRGVLESLVNDLAVHWGGEQRSRERQLRHLTRMEESQAVLAARPGGSELRQRLDRLGRLSAAAKGRALLDEEGCYDNEATKGLPASDRTDIAECCMAFHHMPTPAYGPERDHPEAPPTTSNLSYDPEKIVDFHQALSALGNYPSLQRALGLVFDLELPFEALGPSSGSSPGFLEIIGHSLDGDFLPPKGRARTGFVLLDAGQRGQVFLTASRPGVAHGAFGIAPLVPEWFGLAQVDVDGAMHKNVLLAESLNKNPAIGSKPALAAHPEIYDSGATLPALRSGGLTLYADLRAATWLAGLQQSATVNAAYERGERVDLFAEDLSRGLRLDVWDDRSGQWHSLHERSARYSFFTDDDQPAVAGFDPLEAGFDPILEEGWVESAVTRPAPGSSPADDHYYLHEAVARWSGWSLSAPRPDLSLAADPTRSDPEADKEPDPPTSPFKIKVEHRVRPGSLPALRFGRRYRLRGRWVNLAGLSPCVIDASGGEPCFNNPGGSLLSRAFALPNFGRDGLRYHRFEPVASPLVVVDDPAAILGPGSTLLRLVLRTNNLGIESDAAAADPGAASRHLLPPRISVEMAELIGMFDAADGTLKADAATWSLIASRDGSPPGVSPATGELPQVAITLPDGSPSTIPLITEGFLAELPYLPDAHARGIALRDLPGTVSGSLARIDATTPSGVVRFELLADPNPRPGSALLISFGDARDWQTLQGVRLALGEAGPDTPWRAPHWDADSRTLTVFLAKGQRAVVPLSCYQLPEDLPVMGIWQWFQEEVSSRLASQPGPPPLSPGGPVDESAHILQRTVEGGHWMLTPPVLLELLHALRQPLGRPVFQPLAVRPGMGRGTTSSLQTALTTGYRNPAQPSSIPARRDPDELAALSGWRRPAASECYLLGALGIHGASTSQIELMAEWSDPVDDPLRHPIATGTERETRRAQVDRIALPRLEEGYLVANDAQAPDIDDPFSRRDQPRLRHVGYYDPEHDQLAFVQPGEASLASETRLIFDRIAAPRHILGDTRHHRIRYKALAVSRDADCFTPLPQAEGQEPLGFTRLSDPVEVSIPASSRPLAPDIAYVVPTFGWQRQTDTAIKRSIRYGGGLRVYLRRPWFSSGEGELLGVALWQEAAVHSIDQQERDRHKSSVSQWGMDPIWQTEPLRTAPVIENFPDRLAQASNLTLDERSDLLVDVVGFAVAFDAERQLWYADLTLNTEELDTEETYAPFVRLALVRFQPDALPDARISRVVLADFAQLTPGRAVVVHPHPARANTLRVQISGTAPRGPRAIVHSARPLRPRTEPPTRFQLRVQERIAGLDPELGWRDLELARIDRSRLAGWGLDGTEQEPAALFIAFDSAGMQTTNLSLWEGFVCLQGIPESGRYRLLIEEYEFISNDKPVGTDPRDTPGRLIFAEIIPIDGSLLPTDD